MRTPSLLDIRTRAAELLELLTKEGLIESVERRVREHLTTLSAGVRPQYSFVGGQYVDDQYLARFWNSCRALDDHRSSGQRLEMSGLGYVDLLHIAVTLAANPDTKGNGGPIGAGTASSGRPSRPRPPPTDTGNLAQRTPQTTLAHADRRLEHRTLAVTGGCR